MSGSDEEWFPSNEFLKRSNVSRTKKTCSKAKSTKTSDNKSSLHKSVDSKYLYNFSKHILRVEYPGHVKNITAAVDTLGGIEGVEMAVADHRIKLELHFHPNNKYNKPCSADRDMNPGVLIKVEQSPIEPVGQTPKCLYEVVGVTSLNFKFYRICDFQYLPVVNSTENNVQYIYDIIFPEKLPTLDWFVSKETSRQPKFFLPPNFARFDTSQNRLYLNTGEKFATDIRPELSKLIENANPTKSKKIYIKQVSIFVNLQIPNVQIPDQPLTYTMQLIQEKQLEEQYKNVVKLFEERPVWTKVAIQYKTGINTECAKVVLPAVAYFCPAGPWRMTWIRYEYNPQKEINSRIYQTLDYRIRAKEGTKLKVSAKRSYSSKPSLRERRNVEYTSSIIEERSYILRPNYTPPARQMFYQYCDILLPEIQEMVSRLPKLPPGTKFDGKNGWLPVNFTEQCREIVNKYVIDRVQEELLEDTIKMQQQNQVDDSEKEQIRENPSTYCSKMLSNIKKGIYKTVKVPPQIAMETATCDAVTKDPEIHTIDLSGELEQINADDIFNSIPERMDENSDDEHLSQNSDLVIDMEAVEEVNKMVGCIQEEDEVNVIASFLKETL